MSEIKDYEKMRDIAAELSEHFTDYMIVVRVKNGLEWRYSDRTFALGICQRLANTLIAEDCQTLKIKEERNDC